MKVTRSIEGCFEGILRVFQGSFKGVWKRKFQGCLEEEVSRMFHGCFMIFRGVSRVFQMR